MKKIFVIACMCVGGYALAQVVQGSVFTSYTEQGNSQGSPVLGPTTSSLGIPLIAKGNNGTNQQVKYVNVTVQPIWDGGQGFQISGTAIRAWKFSPQRTGVFDGGGITNWDAGVAFAWARYPSLDFAYSADSGTPYVQNGVGGVTFSTGLGSPYGNSQAAPSLNGSRLYYTVETLTAVDGGTMANARILLEGVY
jgi:hypothetical protein